MYHLEIKCKPISELTSEENTGRQKKKQKTTEILSLKHESTNSGFIGLI